MKHFSSSKSLIAVSILLMLVVFLIITMFISLFYHEIEITSFIILSLTCVMIIWILLDTRYFIKSDRLFYRSGPFRGRIEINKVVKMEYCSDLNSNTLYKPALDFKGFILTYNMGKTIYISPEKLNDFAEEILKINPSIEYKVA